MGSKGGPVEPGPPLLRTMKTFSTAQRPQKIILRITRKSAKTDPALIDDVSTSPPLSTIPPTPPSNPIDIEPPPLKLIPDPFNGSPEVVSRLNLCDRNEVKEAIEYFPLKTRSLLKNAIEKEQFADNKIDKAYMTALYPMIASGAQKAENVLLCGSKRYDHKIPCDKWSICHRCASVRGLKASITFAHTYTEGKFYHVTLGYDGHIPMNETNATDPQDYWLANEAAVRMLLEEDRITGAYMAHELAIGEMLPLKVNPHSHVIITADAFSDELVATMVEKIRLNDEVKLKPVIKVIPIDSESYHSKCIRYLTKPISFVEKYQAAWDKYCSEDREKAPQLNRQLRNFFDHQFAAFNCFSRVKYFGILRSQHPKFIGAKREPKKKSIKRSK